MFQLVAQKQLKDFRSFLRFVFFFSYTVMRNCALSSTDHFEIPTTFAFLCWFRTTFFLCFFHSWYVGVSREHVFFVHISQCDDKKLYKMLSYLFNSFLIAHFDALSHVNFHFLFRLHLQNFNLSQNQKKKQMKIEHFRSQLDDKCFNKSMILKRKIMKTPERVHSWKHDRMKCDAFKWLWTDYADCTLIIALTKTFKWIKTYWNSYLCHFQMHFNSPA